MKRTTKRYVISTSSLNNYKYRVMSDGGDFAQYLKNPILLWMHQRAFSNDKNQILPPGRAVDIQLNGDVWSCYLEFDENDPFAMQLFNKYQAGILNMISLGALPLEWTEEPEKMLPGQVGPTVTKWRVTDISCVDIGGQDEACACQLYDANDNKIELTGLEGAAIIELFHSLQPKTEQNDSMKLITLSAPVASAILLHLKLDDTATEVEVQKKVADLVLLSADQGTQIINLTAAKTNAESLLQTVKAELAESIKLASDAAIITLVDNHKNKYLPVQRDTYIRLAKVDFDGTKTLLEGMPVLTSVKDKLELAQGDTAGELAGLIQLSWKDLHTSGKLERLKELDETAFTEKRNAAFPPKVTKK